MKRANNEEINAYNFPNIQCGFIKIDVNDLANQMQDFYITNSKLERCYDKDNFLDIEKTYTNDTIISFNQNIIHSLYLTHNQFLKIKVTKLESDLEILETHVSDQERLKNVFDSIINAKEHVSRIEQEFLVFFYELSEFVKFEIKCKHNNTIHKQLREYHISKDSEFAAEKLKSEAIISVINQQQEECLINPEFKFDYFAYHLSIINNEQKEIQMRSSLFEKINTLNIGIHYCIMQIDDLSSKIVRHLEYEKLIEVDSQILNNLELEEINPKNTSLIGSDENEACDA